MRPFVGFRRTVATASALVGPGQKLGFPGDPASPARVSPCQTVSTLARKHTAGSGRRHPATGCLVRKPSAGHTPQTPPANNSTVKRSCHDGRRNCRSLCGSRRTRLLRAAALARSGARYAAHARPGLPRGRQGARRPGPHLQQAVPQQLEGCGQERLGRAAAPAATCRSEGRRRTGPPGNARSRGHPATGGGLPSPRREAPSPRCDGRPLLPVHAPTRRTPPETAPDPGRSRPGP